MGQVGRVPGTTHGAADASRDGDDGHGGDHPGEATPTTPPAPPGRPPADGDPTAEVAVRVREVVQAGTRCRLPRTVTTHRHGVRGGDDGPDPGTGGAGPDTHPATPGTAAPSRAASDSRRSRVPDTGAELAMSPITGADRSSPLRLWQT